MNTPASSWRTTAWCSHHRPTWQSLNYIANYIIQNKACEQEFIDKHVNFTKTPTDIGYGLRPEHLEKAAKNAGKGKLAKISFEEYAKSVSEYTLDKAHELSGVPKKNLGQLAKAYADPNKKVTSYWTMGFNQPSVDGQDLRARQ